MNLENLNLVELNAQEVKEVVGGGPVDRAVMYLLKLARDWGVTEAASYAINHSMSAQQSADYYRYRGM